MQQLTLVELFCLLIFLLKFISKCGDHLQVCQEKCQISPHLSPQRCIAGYVWACLKLRKTWKAGVYLEKKARNKLYIYHITRHFLNWEIPKKVECIMEYDSSGTELGTM